MVFMVTVSCECRSEGGWGGNRLRQRLWHRTSGPLMSVCPEAAVVRLIQRREIAKTMNVAKTWIDFVLSLHRCRVVHLSAGAQTLTCVLLLLHSALCASTKPDMAVTLFQTHDWFGEELLSLSLLFMLSVQNKDGMSSIDVVSTMSSISTLKHYRRN